MTEKLFTEYAYVSPDVPRLLEVAENKWCFWPKVAPASELDCTEYTFICVGLYRGRSPDPIGTRPARFPSRQVWTEYRSWTKWKWFQVLSNRAQNISYSRPGHELVRIWMPLVQKSKSITQDILHKCISVDYSAPVGQRSIAINLSVCLSFCPRAYLWNRWTDRHEIFMQKPVAVARFSSGGVAIYFRFYGRSHVWP